MESIIIGAFILLGAIVGSFLNVVILRLPMEGGSIVFPGSHCPSCKTPLRWYDNIPVISYCMIGGKCRYCRKPISLQYPTVEICMALLSGALYVRFGLTLDVVYYFLFTAALLVIIFIDIHHQIIPDSISLPGIVVGMIGSFFVLNITWMESFIGAFLGGGVLYAVAFGYYLVTRRDGMGGGDIKLLAMIGAFLGWPCLLYVVFFSSVTGSIIGIGAMIKQRSGTQTRIPFGPFLSVGALTYLFFENQIFALWQMYLDMSTPS